jgi:hypothetical protein
MTAAELIDFKISFHGFKRFQTLGQYLEIQYSKTYFQVLRCLRDIGVYQMNFSLCCLAVDKFTLIVLPQRVSIASEEKKAMRKIIISVGLLVSQSTAG